MHRKISEYGGKDGDGAGRQGNRIGQDKTGHVAFQPAFETNNARVDQVAHIGVKNEFHHVEVGDEHLAEQPRYVADETEPAHHELAGIIDRKKQSPAGIGHDGAGDNAKGEVERVKLAVPIKIIDPFLTVFKEFNCLLKS